MRFTALSVLLCLAPQAVTYGAAPLNRQASETLPSTTFLLKGSPAPYNGMLLVPTAALALATRAQSCEDRLKVEQQRHQALQDLQGHLTLDLRKALADAEGEGQRCGLALGKAQAMVAADRSTGRPWLWLGLGLGTLLGACITAAVGRSAT